MATPPGLVQQKEESQKIPGMKTNKTIKDLKFFLNLFDEDKKLTIHENEVIVYGPDGPYVFYSENPSTK